MREGDRVAARPIGAHDAITATSESLGDRSRTASTIVGPLAPAHVLSWHSLGGRPPKISVYPGSETKFGQLAAMRPRPGAPIAAPRLSRAA
jgi:hypothetical protein